MVIVVTVIKVMVAVLAGSPEHSHQPPTRDFEYNGHLSSYNPSSRALRRDELLRPHDGTLRRVRESASPPARPTPRPWLSLQHQGVVGRVLRWLSRCRDECGKFESSDESFCTELALSDARAETETDFHGIFTPCRHCPLELTHTNITAKIGRRRCRRAERVRP